ncbi:MULTISPECIES: dTDP-4-dehydrorhamnose reductase [unclassified Polaribacter]|uniref:dTDP-4-dehydrorhamnose reductase n=1 Tax=unclassified Polaribacter TaxID=196858 RepID=UPI0011BE7776|nr:MULTISPECIES: dTDP-4-dehydrorhamnose reductase [unclassified Polaribacter]TXD53004.1 dTDP-4-dehydrorhamnose reductase [Polaribacter sp. IC063]TXD60904.1 dTDP-4-dehydrorhamnose reductase [Polaribacter sp. IC066]
MINILITGANGQLGSELKALEQTYATYNFHFTDYKELDITNHAAVDAFVKAANISVIINCAAHTAVDKAETDKEMSTKLNHLAVENFAKIAKTNNIQLIHISTDYVFDGTNHIPYSEDDKTNPQSVYGSTKLAGEQAMQKINPANSIIIRTSWVYSNFGNNFVKTMLRLANERDELGVILDQVGTPTYARDLAKLLLEIIPKINNTNVEVYHFSNKGVSSWYDFAKAIFDLKEIDIKLNAIETSQYPTAAKRPFYSVLNKNKIENTFQLEIPYWRDSLKECLKKL